MSIAQLSSKLRSMRASRVGRSYSSSPITTACWPEPSFPNRLSIKARPRKSDISGSRFRRRFVGPLEHHVDADGAVRDAVLVGRNQGNRTDQFPSVGAGVVDTRIQAADHTLFALAENHHAIEIFPLHRFDSFVPRMFCAGAAPRQPFLGHLGLAPAFVQPACGDGQHLVVEFKIHVVEPAWQVTDKTVVMLNLGVQVVLDIAQLGLRKARLQSLRTLENGWDIALGIQQQTRTIMRRDGTEGIQQLDHIPGVRLTYGGTGKSLEHPLALW